MIEKHDERVLLLLGLLSTHRQHGYQINEYIGQNLGEVAHMKKATAYALLTRLEEAGLVQADSEQAGNRPMRRVYSITESGRETLREMQEAILAQPEHVIPAGEVAVMLIDSMDAERGSVALTKRIEALDEQIGALESAPPHEGHQGTIDLALERRIALLRADRAWFAGVKARLERGELGQSAHSVHPHVGL